MSAAFDARLGPNAAAPVKPHLDRPLDIRLALILLAVLALGLFYMAYSIRSDLSASGGGPTTILPFLLLGVALLIALGACLRNRGFCWRRGDESDSAC